LWGQLPVEALYWCGASSHFRPAPSSGPVLVWGQLPVEALYWFGASSHFRFRSPPSSSTPALANQRTQSGSTQPMGRVRWGERCHGDRAAAWPGRHGNESGRPWVLLPAGSHLPPGVPLSPLGTPVPPPTPPGDPPVPVRDPQYPPRTLLSFSGTSPPPQTVGTLASPSATPTGHCATGDVTPGALMGQNGAKKGKNCKKKENKSVGSPGWGEPVSDWVKLGWCCHLGCDIG